jgi:inhibitor of cysteine peptidase
MKKKFLILSLLSVLIISLFTFLYLSNSNNPNINEGQIHNISINDNGSTIRVRKGDEINLSLDGAPSTGYSWELVNLDKNILEQEGDMIIRSTPPIKKPGGMEVEIVGGPGTYNFSFIAVESGETSLHLIYHRLWEKDIEPEDEFYLNVKVSD